MNADCSESFSRVCALALPWSLVFAILAAPTPTFAQAETIALATGTSTSRVAPDGSFVVYRCDADTTKLCLYEIETGAYSSIAPRPSGVNPSNLDLSNNADFLAFHAFHEPSGHAQVYLYDRAADSLELISKAGDGTPADAVVEYPRITPDGRYVTFLTKATNLGLTNTNGVRNLYLHDRDLGTLEIISRGFDGSEAEPDLSSTIPRDPYSDLSDDGDCVVFSSRAINMVADDSNGSRDVFLYRRSTEVMSRVSVDSQGQEVDLSGTNRVAVAGDCTAVAFVADGRDFETDGLDPDKTGREDEAFMRDLVAENTFLISGRPGGTETACGSDDSCPRMIIDDRADLYTSRDGRYTAFRSSAIDLVASDTNGLYFDIFIHDREQNLTTLETLDPGGEQFPTDVRLGFGMSADGRYLAFTADDGSGDGHKIYLRDRGDLLAPLVGLLRTVPAEPAVGEIVDVLATASDRLTGGSVVVGAEFRIDAGSWLPMDPADGAFDSDQEEVAAVISAETLATGDHEICARATDILGHVSEPECITVFVSQSSEPAIDDWTVFCRHSPLFPQAGDDVEIFADSIPIRDGQAEPLLVAAVEKIEIWANDQDAPAAETDGLSDTFTHVVENVPPGSFAYGCRVLDGANAAFTGWRRVAVGDSPTPAVPVHFTGPSSERIDIVFFADSDDYTGFDDPVFIENIQDFLQYGYFNRLWFLENQQWFNFWLAQDMADGYREDSSGDAEKGIIKPDNWDADYSFADSAAVIHLESFRDFARDGGFTAQHDRLNVIAHETGHRPFGLADEYCCDGGNYESDPLPNLYDTLEECEEDAPALDRSPADCRSFINSDDEEWFTSEPGSNDLMRDNMQPQAADLRRMNWMIQQCAEGSC